jgi:predicted branched-subunit amino acid permease
MKQVIQGIKDGSAIGIGYFSVSFTFGLAAVSSGLRWWEALLTSMMNLTSAGQFAGLTVMTAEGTYIEMAVSQFIINLRYALMSISLSQKVDRRFGAGKKMILGFANTDEIFAVAMSRRGEVSSRYFLGLAALPYLGWTLGTLAGAVLGNILPQSVSDALGLAIYGMFIAIVVPEMKKDRNIMKMVILTVLLSCCIYYIPVFRHISQGFAIIICAVAASAVGAVCFPIETEDGTEREILEREIKTAALQETEPKTAGLQETEAGSMQEGKQ